MARPREIAVLDIAHLADLNKSGRIQLRPDFQRNALWPAAAKSYLIDTIIHDRPIPLIFLQPYTSPQTGLMTYAVVDGQQRLSAIFDYLEDGFRLSGPDVSEYSKLRFSRLPSAVRQQILEFGLIAEILRGYSPKDVREIFVRLNKYGVRLSQQELRHARGSGVFKDTVERLGRDPKWVGEGFISFSRSKRMRADELVAELLILLAEEGPQDKKGVVDDYYASYEEAFPEADALIARMDTYISWVRDVLGGWKRARFRKPVDLYGLIGALERLSDQGERLTTADVTTARRLLEAFDKELRSSSPTARANRYLLAASQQTDNVGPRRTRIDVLAEVLKPAFK